MTLEDTKRILVGEWVSFTPEVRPSATRNPDGTLKPFYLSREFKYLGDDRFELTISNWADPYDQVAVARIDLRGHIEWVGERPIASGAQKANFIADEAYEVTPMIAGFADLLNKVASAGFAPWQAGQRQSVFGKTFEPFGLAEGRNFMEYDLIYVQGAICSGGQETLTPAASTPSRTGQRTSRSRCDAKARIEGEWHDDLSSRPARGQAHFGDRWRHGAGP